MTSRDFCYWLQGYFEINGSSPGGAGGLDHLRVDMIKKHLAMVFAHGIDPSFPGDQQHTLDKLHIGTPLNPPIVGSGSTGAGTQAKPWPYPGSISTTPPFDPNVKYRC